MEAADTNHVGRASASALPHNTLVELIVVLVILAILAAILVPALLGWIDKAKDKQYVLDARNVYLATQTIMDQHYAKGLSESEIKKLTDAEKLDIKKIADVTFSDISDIGFEARKNAEVEGGTLVAAKINAMKITGMGDKGDITATLGGGTWEITKGTGSTTSGSGTD